MTFRKLLILTYFDCTSQNFPQGVITRIGLICFGIYTINEFKLMFDSKRLLLLIAHALRKAKELEVLALSERLKMLKYFYKT